MQSERPAGTLQIDPQQGFGPHLSDAFLDLYGEDSVFVNAAVDLLTWQFVAVLIKAEKLPADFVPIQYGTPEMRHTLDALLKTLAGRGLEKPSTALMRSAVGQEQPQAFQTAASTLLGYDLVSRWLQRLEQHNYAGADALLAMQ
ncbi:MAG: hypothetical protein M0Q42_12335 [Xanthomonadales bacterium]|nr:hypothetical protein [Xanthomonadales bacterium]